MYEGDGILIQKMLSVTMIPAFCMRVSAMSVSYTHLDVYKRQVVFFLKFFNLAFNRDIFKNWLPFGQDSGMPQACHSAIPI